jgi:DnaJ-class molecular chaperone
LVEEQAVVNFEVPPGVALGENITAEWQGHRLPGRNPGNAVLVCNIEEHPSFLRRGNDLMTEQCVPLHLALCGGVFEVPHLGGRTLRVRVPRGMVLRPGMIKSVPCEGMPKRHNVHLHGDLLLRFAVDFPDTLPEDTAMKLEALLTGNPESALAQQEEPIDYSNEVYLADSDLRQFGRSSYAVWNSAHNADLEEERS